MRTFLSVLFLAGLGLLAGCSPSLSPLYRDYKPRSSASYDTTLAPVKSALRAAGWRLTTSDVSGTITTKEKTLQHWGIYTIEVSLEAVPMDAGRYVRLLVHPHRDFLLGGDSKLVYLPPSLGDDFLPALNKTFRNRGLIPIGTPFTRNELSH